MWKIVRKCKICSKLSVSVFVFRNHESLRLHEVQKRERLENGRGLSASWLQRSRRQTGLGETVAVSRNRLCLQIFRRRFGFRWLQFWSQVALRSWRHPYQMQKENKNEILYLSSVIHERLTCKEYVVLTLQSWIKWTARSFLQLQVQMFKTCSKHSKSFHGDRRCLNSGGQRQKGTFNRLDYSAE